MSRPEKVRVNLLALGDVGSTLLLGLRLMGGDVISSIGICDLREGVARRWEFELNQIQLPGPYDALPPVEIVPPERLFDGDVFLFCASRFVPDTAVKTGDVRMAQYRLNRELAALYARKAREARYRGLFCVVSDPVDPLCRAVLTESNRAPGGGMDYQGLLTCQVRGFGLGVMNARAAYYARQDPRFASFLTDGRTFGPHGEDLVVANSIDRYDDGAVPSADGADRPRQPPDAGDGLQALCGPGPVLRSAEPAAVSAGPVALLVHISGRRVHGGPEPGDAGGHGAGASAPALAAARSPANHYGSPAGHRLTERGREPCPSRYCCRRTYTAPRCGPCWSRCCLRAASSAARRTAWRTCRTGGCCLLWPWTPAAATWPIMGCSGPAGQRYSAAGQRGRGHRHRRGGVLH
ncbi:MAG: hypothetical protein ACLUNQ_06160 [Oscillospiraceae bacterium]